MNWTCNFCETLNPHGQTHCEVCQQPMPLWACPACEQQNLPWATACAQCHQQRPAEQKPSAGAHMLADYVPLMLDLKPVWKVPGKIHIYGMRNTPVYRELNAGQRFIWKNLPFLSSEERYKNVVWEGTTPVRIKVREDRVSYSEEKSEFGHPGNVISASISADGETLYTTDTQDRVISWNAQTGEMLSSRVPKLEKYLKVVSTRGVVIGGYELGIRIWHPSGEVQYSVPNPSKSPIKLLQLTPRKDLLVAVSEKGEVMVWEYTGAERHPFRPIYTTKIQTHRITHLTTASDPFRFAVALDNGEVVIWGVETLHSAPLHRRFSTTSVSAVDFSTYGPQLLVADHTGGIMVFRDEMDRSPTGFRLKDTRRGAFKVGCVKVVSPEGHLIAGDSLGQLQIWDWPRQQLIKVIQTGIPGLHTLVVNEGPRHLVVAGTSGSLACYSLEELVG